METLLQDLRYAIRSFLKNPLIVVITIFSIALGIGANTTVFSAVNSILLKSLPYREPERIAIVWGNSTEEGNLNNRNQVSATDVADWRKQNRVFEEITTFTGWMPIFSGRGEAERIPAIQVGDGFFRVMNGKPILGRVFLPEEQQEGKDFVVVLGYNLWERKFGGDRKIIGSKVLLNGRPYTVVGVMPQDFRPLPASLVLPEGEFYRPVAEPYDETQRDARHLRAIARLKDGITLEQAQSEMDLIAKRIEQSHPETNSGYGIRVVTLTEDTVGGIRKTLWVLFMAVTFVLLVACANVGNLLLAKSSSRQKEISVRAALGAGQRRLLRQLLTESILLSVIGGIAGLVFSLWGMKTIESVGARVTPLLQSLSLDWRVLVFTLFISILTGVIFGLAPATHLLRLPLVQTLKEGGTIGSFGRKRLGNFLVVAEIAITMILLLSAGLLIQTVLRLKAIHPGFNTENLLTMNVGLPMVRYPERRDWITFYENALTRLESIPGVRSAATVSVLPLSDNFDGRGLAVEDFPRPPGREISVDLYVVSPHYLQTMQIPVLKGRAISERDTENAPFVALINETMVRRFWPNQDPIGKRIKFAGSGSETQPWRTIVGVVNDVAQYRLDQEPVMQLYLPHQQFPTSFNSIVVKTTSRPEAIIVAVRYEIRALDKDQAVWQLTTMEQLLSDSISLRRFLMILLVLFAGVALSLAAVGIYGVISYGVEQQTREIGIRMSLGATRMDVLRLIIGQGILLTFAGIFCGTAAALAVLRMLSSLLFQVSAYNPHIFTAVTILLAIVALIACWFPARKAMKMDPLVALRYE